MDNGRYRIIGMMIKAREEALAKEEQEEEKESPYDGLRLMIASILWGFAIAGLVGLIFPPPC